MSRALPLPRPALSDFIALSKPGITVFAVLAAAVGASVVPGSVPGSLWFPLLVGTALIVGSANAFNMYLEREVDCHMARTRNRPLPAGRMGPEYAFAFAVVQGLVGLPLLSVAVHPLAGLLGLIALIVYVNMYTPLKQRTTASLLIGSVPGAMPVLIGSTAVLGRIEWSGLAVFGVLFLWQIPHFQAIALFRWKEYQRAGHKVWPVEHGMQATRWNLLLFLLAQVFVSVLIYFMGVAGVAYLIVALALGALYIGYALYGLVTQAGPKWARKVFLISLIYLPAIFTALVVDGLY